MMTKDELLVMMQENIRDYLPEHIKDSCEVQIVEVAKNNDRVLKGFVFDRGENIPCPTFYIEDAYEHYLKGDTPEEIMQDLALAVEQSWDMEVPLTDISMEYDSIKDKLAFQLVDGCENKERLKTCVHTKLGNDLAMIYYIEMTQESSFMRAVISNDMAEEYNYDIKQLKADAHTNMEKMHPAQLFSPSSMMMEMMMEGHPTNLLAVPEMVLDDRLYVLTNEKSIYGASTIMYDGIQEKLGNMFQGNYYVIPSSTQELMIVPANGGHDARELLGILKDANEKFVEPEEFLSNRLFMYDRGEKLLAEVKVPNRGRELEWER